MTVVFTEHDVAVWQGDALEQLTLMPAGSVQCALSSPPYFGLRDYCVDGQLGLESSPAEYVARMVAVFAEVRRVLAADGVLWLNLGDSYVSKPAGNVRGVSDRSGLHGAQTSEKYRDTLTRGMGTKRDTTGHGIAEKNLLGMPWRVAFALQDDGWILRNAVVWHKPNAMPESVTDRLSTRYELVFLFSKSRRYWFDLDAIREDRSPATLDRYRYAFQVNGNPASKTGNLRDGGMITKANEAGRNPGDVWNLPTAPFPGAHFACMPPALAERCIKAGCPPGGTVLDPFAGSGTTLAAARKLGRKSVGIELNTDYIDLIRSRIGQTPFDFGGLDSKTLISPSEDGAVQYLLDFGEVAL